jgi:hypothetical protein
MSEDVERLAGDAIGLFLEYRDQHGYAEPDARARAVAEVVEGVAARNARTPCPVCPHWLELHNADGSCGCGLDCAAIARADSR